MMPIAFFDCEGVVHHEYVPQGQTVNQYFYIEVFRRLEGTVRRRRPEKWRSGEWLLHHDNAPSHSALLVRSFLTKNGMTVVPHPPYSLDLAFFSFLN